MRGKENVQSFIIFRNGITPAYAGKRQVVSGVGSIVEDHPRLCGEKFHGFSQLMAGLGSPPPMRGKAIKNVFNGIGEWITPAYAGKRIDACDALSVQ